MAKRRRNRAQMGRALTAAGLSMKIIQIIASAFSVDALTGSLPTVITACFLVGGLAVFVVENLNLTGVFAFVSLIGVMGTLFPTITAVIPFVFLSVSILAFCALLFTLRSKYSTYAAIACAVLYLLIALHAFGAFALPGAVIAVILVLIYSALGAGLYI